VLSDAFWLARLVILAVAVGATWLTLLERRSSSHGAGCGDCRTTGRGVATSPS
jgi:hypothetical protein